jgi:hypothetical protein
VTRAVAKLTILISLCAIFLGITAPLPAWMFFTVLPLQMLVSAVVADELVNGWCEE